jgi:hypothetical protein
MNRFAEGEWRGLSMAIGDTVHHSSTGQYVKEERQACYVFNQIVNSTPPSDKFFHSILPPWLSTMR